MHCPPTRWPTGTPRDLHASDSVLQICQDKVAPELMENYLKVRAERWLNLTSYVFAKWHIKALFDETGKTISIDGETSRPVIDPVQRVVVNATHPYRKYFEQVSEGRESWNSEVV